MFIQGNEVLNLLLVTLMMESDYTHLKEETELNCIVEHHRPIRVSQVQTDLSGLVVVS
jgi:hypothetical protein